MRLAALASLLVAACWSQPAPSTPTNVAVAPAAPTSPAPAVAIAPRAEGFTAVHLPAVSQDGSRVLFAIEDGDGGRGYPNLRLELRDRDDHIVATQVVLAADDAGGYLQEPELQARLAPRLAAANAWLAEQHRALAFVPLTDLHVANDAEYGSAGKHLATAGDVTLDWDGARVKIADAKTTLLERPTPDDWHAKPYDSGAGFQCQNGAFLDGAFLDVAHRVALVEVGYTGTDTCWEPNDQHHVVAW